MSLPPPAGFTRPKNAQDPVSRLLRDLVHEHTGVYFESDRLELMLEKLEARAVAKGCTSYLDYYYILKYDDAEGPQEWRRVMDVFSVQETYFWREFDQIRAVVEQVVPAWFKQSARPLCIWSAACATGEEPYSIAMALREGGWDRHPIRIVASDASEAALARARACFYRERSFRALPVALREKYFEPRGDGFLLSPEISARVNFRWANLVALDPPEAAGEMNVIFCRNVFIYFSQTSIRRVIASFAERVPVGGHLLVGSSESLLKLTDRFHLQELGGAFVYVRKEAE